jgi:hypothetical protein
MSPFRFCSETSNTHETTLAVRVLQPAASATAASAETTKSAAVHHGSPLRKYSDSGHRSGASSWAAAIGHAPTSV